ncbi:RNA polymerase sigma-70 factor (ECF subfamily) [Arthrobacter sp. CAN_A212]|uniref:hypothetical protein n=1 Tax=Arthrobacter sp. CAN_A212 TaxID=2787719 RepID=UPI0018C8E5CA
MNELQLLKETRKTDQPVPTETLDRGLAQLMSAIEKGTPRASIPQRWLFSRRSLLTIAATAALIIGPVAVNIALPEAPTGASAEAAEFLGNAAVATINTADPLVGEGQYLKTDIKALYGNSLALPDGEQATWLATQDSQLYIPADRSEEWVWNREEEVPVTFFSEAAREAAEEVTASSSPFGQVVRAAGGAFYGSGQLFLDQPLHEAMRDAPRDPQELLSLIYTKTEGQGWSPEHHALTTIADFLRTGAVPADLRSALYHATALIEGVEIVEKGATIDGRSGTAIGIQTPDGGGRQDIIIDVETGMMIGERSTVLKPTPQYPAGTVTSWTAIETSVVNAAP